MAAAVAGLAVSLLPVAHAAAGKRTPFTTQLPAPAGYGDGNVITGPDGNFWLSGPVRMTPSGVTTEYSVPTDYSAFPNGAQGSVMGSAWDLTPGPPSDPNSVWFTDLFQGEIGRIDVTTGAVKEYFLGTVSAPCNNQRYDDYGKYPAAITTGPDGNLWFTEQCGPDPVGRITPSGTITQFSVAGIGYSLGGDFTATAPDITAGPDGNLWFTDALGCCGPVIGRITPQGVSQTIALPTTSNAQGITSGPDGNIWFADSAVTCAPGCGNSAGKIGRVTPAGVVTEFPLPSSEREQPVNITAGPDGNLWFTSDNEVTYAPIVGRMTTAGRLKEFTPPQRGPFDITVGPPQTAAPFGSNVWFVDGQSLVEIDLGVADHKH